MCGIQEYASAQFLDFLELAENCSFLDRKLISALRALKKIIPHLACLGSVTCVPSAGTYPDMRRCMRLGDEPTFGAILSIFVSVTLNETVDGH